MEWYIEREAGVVVGLTRWPIVENQERLPEIDPDVQEFLNRIKPPSDPTTGELLDAVGDAIKLSDTAKLDALLAKRGA